MKNDAAACVKCRLTVMERSKMIEWVNHNDDRDDENYDSNTQICKYKHSNMKTHLLELAEDERELTEFAESRP